MLWQGRKRRVASLANVLAALSEKEREQLGELVDVLQSVIRRL
jgi:hypothetical protein